MDGDGCTGDGRHGRDMAATRLTGDDTSGSRVAAFGRAGRGPSSYVYLPACAVCLFACLLSVCLLSVSHLSIAEPRNMARHPRVNDMGGRRKELSDR